MKIRFICTFPIFYLVVITNVIFGQSSDSDHHQHDGYDYEVGLSLGMAQLEYENETAMNIHGHLFRKLGSEDYWKRFAIGIGIEAIFVEHKHYSFLGTISYNPVAALIIDLAPGILMSEHDNQEETNFITHIELTYEFDFESFSIGPVIGMAISEEDKHYMVGIHFGKAF